VETTVPAFLDWNNKKGSPMLNSTDRLMTTDVGSLPRNDTLTDLLIRQEAGEVIDSKLSLTRSRQQPLK
jgi:hypothetical protein